MSVRCVSRMVACSGRILIEETDRPDVYKITRKRGGEVDPIGHVSGYDLRDLSDVVLELLAYLETAGEASS